MSYADEIIKPSSEKHTLAWIEPSQRLAVWSLYSGSVYSRSVEHLVIDVKVDNTSLVNGSSSSLNAGEWYFEFNTKTLFVRMSDDSNPSSSFISANYRIFFGTTSIKLSSDLSSADHVEYMPSIQSISEFPLGIDPANQSGISLESSGSISFFRDDFWVDNFDKLFWENKNIVLYSYINTEIQKLFEGEVINKSYSETKVTLNIKDFVYKLQQPITSLFYSSSDGDIADSVVGKPKRTIYGKVDGLKIQSVDQVLTGYDVTGTLTFTQGSTSVSGSGTAFLKELSPNDELKFIVSDVERKYRIGSITSDTALNLTEKSLFGATTTVTSFPEIPYRYKNREFIVSGHKLRAPSTTVVAALSLSRINVASIDDFLIDDTIQVGSETAEIKRITGDTLVLKQNLDNVPVFGTAVTKDPINKVYFNQREMFIDRDWTSTNTSTGCNITLEDDAEFNQTTTNLVIGTATFTNGSRDISGISSEFTKDFKSRDWIRSDDINHTTWYEILEVTDATNIILRTAYAGTNTTTNAEKKNVTYIDDNSIVTTNCIGKENDSGEWVKTASDAVKDILSGVGVTNIDTDSFEESDIEAPYILSMAIPLSPTNEAPKARDVINLINKSVFGSLVSKNDFTTAYNILSAQRPSAAVTIGDDDIISFSIQTKTDVVRKVTAKYRHQDADLITGKTAFSIESYESDFVDNLIGSNKEIENDIYLYDSEDAQTIAQRITYLKSLTQSILSIKAGGLNLSDKNINDKVYLSLDKLYKRYGTASDRSKIGIISSISKNGDTLSMKISDLGNIFNRTGAVTENTASDFDDAVADELILNGYIVDNNTELPSSTEDEIETNLIG